MADLLVIAYPTEAKAEEVRSRLLGMQQEYLIQLGDAVVAARGALGGKLSDAGINDQFMRDVAANLDSGHAALFLLIRKMTADKVMAELQGAGGTVMRSSFDETKEQALRDALAGAQAVAASAPAAG